MSERADATGPSDIVRLGGEDAAPEDFAIPVCCQNGAEVLVAVRKHHSRWKASQETTP